MADIASHLADLARYVTGLDPERLLARFSTLHPVRQRPSGATRTFSSVQGRTNPFLVTTEDQASLLVNYSGGVHATFELSQVAAGHNNDLEIEVLGTRGSARWRQEQPEEIDLGSRDAQRTVRLKDSGHPFMQYPAGHLEGYPDAITNVIRAFYAALQGQSGVPPHPTFADGLAAAQFTWTAYESARQDRWVRVDSAVPEAAAP